MNNQHLSWCSKMLFVSLLTVLFISKAGSQTLTQTPVTYPVNYAIGGYYEALPLEYNNSPAKKFPLLIAIHGIGELGSGSQQSLQQLLLHGVTKVIDRDRFPAHFTVNGETFSFIVISPQYKANHRDAETVQTLIDYCVQKYRVDESRIYLTGLSMGGGISWIYAKKQGYGSRIAALVPVCGNTNASASGIDNIVATNLPVWATHNQGDDIVPASNSINWVNGLNGNVPAINPTALLTIFPSSSHDAWTKTYNPTYRPNGLNVYEWMLQYKRTSAGTTNQPPVVNAGGNKTITLPQNSVSLTGTATDADGTIAGYTWTKTAGPNTYSINNATSPTTTVSNLAEGVYTFQLKVTDNNGAGSVDNVQVTVLAAPVVLFANAGNDTLIYKNQTRPDTAVLSGNASANTALLWTKMSGPGNINFTAATAATTYAIGLQQGVYEFRLTANGIVSDTVTITIKDWQQKNVTACRPGGGKSFIITTVGGGSFYKPYINRDGVVGEKVMGGDTLYFKGGTYSGFEVGDFGGAPGCPVYILPKDAPVIIKDGYFRIGFRDSNVVQHAVLDGTTLRGAGHPYGFVIDNSHLPIGAISHAGLVANWVSNFTVKGYRSYNTGLMQIKLDAKEKRYGRFDKFIQKRIVITDNFINYSKTEGMYIGHTDADGGQAGNSYGPPPRMDSVEITDNIVMNCGWDGIQLANSRNGNIIKNNFVYKTSLLRESGQRAGIILGGNASGTIDSNLVINSQGTGIQTFGYGIVKLTGNVLDSIMSNDDVHDGTYQSYIATKPEVNTPLSAHNTGNLISRASSKFLKIADNTNAMLPGSNTGNYFIHPTATNANSLITDNANGVNSNNTIIQQFLFKVNSVSPSANHAVISMTQGNSTQTFRDAKETIDWLFSRLFDPNNAPVANAGNDSTIRLPLDSAALNGGATDTDGTITSYKWKKISGPSQYSIRDTAAAKTIVSDLKAGTYGFVLTVLDNDGATDKDTVYITVNAALPTQNTAPVVNAGQNLSITLPVDSIYLNGNATDADGFIVRYKWKKISGPQQHQISADTSKQTTVTNLVAGVYSFELKAVDNEGGSDKDTVIVLVNACLPLPNIPPAALAGNDTTNTLPKDSITLSGNGTDLDGTIAHYNWSKISGPSGGVIINAAQQQVKIKNLLTGTYLFRLKVTDNAGETGVDTVAVFVQQGNSNKVPFVNAGSDITTILPLDSVVLKGIATDEDGSIQERGWTKISGPDGAKLENLHNETKLTNLVKGIYQFSFSVKDDKGAIAMDTLTIRVELPSQPMITINAGTDRVIPAPFDSVVVKAVVQNPFGIALNYNWKQLSGPAGYKIVSGLATQTGITQLKKGTYFFSCTATDKWNNQYNDTVKIEVADTESSRLSVYPNPAVTTTTIKIEAATKKAQSSLVVYNQTGKVVYAESFFRSEAVQTKQLDVTHLLPGVYFIEVTLDINHKSTTKFIKQ